MELQKGRPTNDDGRQEKEIQVYNLLDSLGVEYDRIDHAAADTMEACRAIDEKLGVDMCKNLFLCNRQKTEFYLLLMPGDKPYRTRTFSKLAQTSRLSFGSAEDMERLLNITPGSVSIMGLMNDTKGEVKLYIDKDVLLSEYMGCHPCVNTSSIRVKTKDVTETFLRAVGHGYTVAELPYEWDE